MRGRAAIPRATGLAVRTQGRCGLICVLVIALSCAEAPGEEGISTEMFGANAKKTRGAAITSVEPTVRSLFAAPSPAGFVWKVDIRTTVFHVGGRGGQKQSAWDANWAVAFGGEDNPLPSKRTKDFRPTAFVPKQNPFYCALPYNDLARGMKREAASVIPWFKATFERPGQSVCQNRWIAIRNRKTSRVAYAQWSDCGPHGGAQADYVFGSGRPKGNRRTRAGLDVSPAVRDYLGMGDTCLTDWRFVETHDVPPGPWRTYGSNNPFVRDVKMRDEDAGSGTSAERITEPDAEELPPSSP